TALRADRVRHGLAAFGVDVGEDDPRPLTRQAARVRLADPLRRAGDDGGPAFETCHGASPVLVVDGRDAFAPRVLAAVMPDTRRPWSPGTPRTLRHPSPGRSRTACSRRTAHRPSTRYRR